MSRPTLEVADLVAPGELLSSSATASEDFQQPNEKLIRVFCILGHALAAVASSLFFGHCGGRPKAVPLVPH
jgi:hypothetical protein